MKTIDNIRWLDTQRYQRRHRPGYTIAGIFLALALWAAIGFVCAVLIS